MRQPILVLFFVFVLFLSCSYLFTAVDVIRTASKHNERLMCEVDFKKVYTFRCDDPLGPAIIFWLIVAYVSSVVNVHCSWLFRPTRSSEPYY